MQRPDFFRPLHFVTLAGSLANRPRGELGVPLNLQAYAARMGLWQALNLEPPVIVSSRDTEARFVPLVRLDDPNLVHDCAQELAAITATYGADEQTQGAIFQCMQELLGNCFAHARVSAPLKALACAQMEL